MEVFIGLERQVAWPVISPVDSAPTATSADVHAQGYAMEELVAELELLFSALSLDHQQTPRKDHAPYISSWLQVLKKASDLHGRRKAQEAVDWIKIRTES
jgi:antirestriction protein ArdC